MSAFVVDTNVVVTANEKCDHAGPDCVVSCIEALRGIVTDGMAVLDDGMAILSEYLDHASLSGQPGVGDAFVKWVWANQANPARCEVVHVTPRGMTFAEFPADPALVGFDPDDRKFVAAASASRQAPTVLNAVDSDWEIHRSALEGHGVRITTLCADEVRRAIKSRRHD